MGCSASSRSSSPARTSALAESWKTITVCRQASAAEQRGAVAAHRLARVGGVDEREVDVPALAPELGQHPRQELGRVADVEGHVVELAGELGHLRVEVEGVDVLGVGRDAPQAAALEGPDLDRQPRAQLGQKAVEREALALLHLPAIGGHRGQCEERVHARA